MRVFVTGASGWIGRGLVPELTAAGHEVTGLARSHASARALQAAGAKVRLGSLDDLATLREPPPPPTASSISPSSTTSPSPALAGATAADRAAIGTFGEALAGTGKPFVIASGILGVLGLPPGAVATERDGLAVAAGDRAVPISGAGGRMANAHYTRALAGHGVRSSIVRLPPATHGNGDNGFIPAAIGFAREKGAAAYVGDGANRWPSVHRDDAARLFRLALESAPPGRCCTRSATKACRSARSPRSSPHISAFPPSPSAREQAGEYVGWLGGFWGLDGPASAQITRDLLGWEPTRPGTDRRPQGGPLLPRRGLTPRG